MQYAFMKTRMASQTVPAIPRAGVCTLALLLLSASALAAPKPVLHSHVPSAIKRLQPTGAPPISKRLDLAIGLPFRNPEAVTNFLNELYDPASTNFHRFLTPRGFTDRFGPTAQDYEAVKAFARSNSLAITATHDNRLLLDVSGTVPVIEKAFHVSLRTYLHPEEAREFYAPDAPPSVELAVPLLEVNGLDNYDLPHPFAHPHPGSRSAGAYSGSEPNGNYWGTDFRNAYVPGTTLNGFGQIVGLVEFDGYFVNDITTYETQSGLPNIPLQNVLVDGASGNPSGNTNAVGEVSLDIEMVIAMATNLSSVVVFEAPAAGTSANWVDMLNRMASSNTIRQFSCSWGLGSPSVSGDLIFQSMAGQGQTFFTASGDGDAYITPIPWPSDSPWVISVGGTTLNMNGAGASYASETVWNSGLLGTAWFSNGKSGYWGSGGGVSTTYNLPNYQLGVNFGAVGGSSTKRNIPDVALTANQVWVNYFNGLATNFIGTSCAAPLWAGFTALVNQKAAADGKPSVGFINPALYAMGKDPSYVSVYHDVTNGNSAWSTNNFFYAANGFDLCTGWGTPTTNMITALENFAGVVWVKFGIPGPGTGAYDNPYNTLARGTNGVPVGGTVVIQGPGSSSETMTISKPFTLNAADGAATIGQ
jgi:subtilase family serine protease